MQTTLTKPTPTPNKALWSRDALLDTVVDYQRLRRDVWAVVRRLSAHNTHVDFDGTFHFVVVGTTIRASWEYTPVDWYASHCTVSFPLDELCGNSGNYPLGYLEKG